MQPSAVMAMGISPVQACGCSFSASKQTALHAGCYESPGMLTNRLSSGKLNLILEPGYFIMFRGMLLGI